MEYNIQAPDNVVEASYSTDPDDVSVVSVRIVATLEPATESLGDLKAIEFVVPPELTTNPSSITPQAHSFADWEMQVQGATFVASPRWPSEQSPGGSVNQPSPPDGGWVFYLRDVEIVDSPGSAEITVREVRGAQTDEKGRLKLRKIHPSLRIDYFRVIDADGEPLDASTRSTEPVTLAWATTSATSVSLWGPSIDGLGDRGGAVSDDDSVTIRPETTSVYTLVASNASSHTVGQVTVTVTDQTVVRVLNVQEHIDGDLTVEELTVEGDVVAKGRLRCPTDYVERQSSEMLRLEAWGNRHLEVPPPFGGTLKPHVLDAVSFNLVHEVPNVPLDPGNLLTAVDSRWYSHLLRLDYEVSGSHAVLSHGGRWAAGSDEALKKDIEDLPSVMEKVRRLRPIQFSWKRTGVSAIGLIAQDVEDEFPQLVVKSRSTTGAAQKSLDYSGLGVVAIGAVRELEETLLAQIDRLERRVDELTERLERPKRP